MPAVRGLRNHTTIEISLPRIDMVSGLVLERMWMTKAVQSRNEFACSRLSDTSFSILGRQYQGNASLSPNRGLGGFGMVVGYSKVAFLGRQILQERAFSRVPLCLCYPDLFHAAR